jgi:hypothetical protein
VEYEVECECQMEEILFQLLAAECVAAHLRKYHHITTDLQFYQPWDTGMDVYLWLFIGSSILFLGGSLMEFGLETMYSWSILIKLTAPFCLASSLYYVYGALSLGELVEHSFSGNLISLIACCVLLVVRFIRILIMTKMQWINGLILSNKSELKL